MSTPFISIIIVTRHREQILWETLSKALAATSGRIAEIIVVNDGDEVLEVPGKFADKIFYYNNPGYGVSVARNFGVSKATGDILFFIDDDMWINSEAIGWINEFVIEEKLDAAAYILNWEYPQQLQNKLHKTKVGRYIRASNYTSLWGRLHMGRRQPTCGIYPYSSVGSGSLVISKEMFNRIGGYTKELTFQGEDEDISQRLREQNIPIYLVFDVTLHHNHVDRLEVKNFLRRTYDGFGSEFIAIKKGLKLKVAERSYGGFSGLVFELCRKTEQAWIFILKVLPNTSLLHPFSNRLIGALGGLQRYKQWKNNFG